jgi:hypothetical protein
MPLLPIEPLFPSERLIARGRRRHCHAQFPKDKAILVEGPLVHMRNEPVIIYEVRGQFVHKLGKGDGKFRNKPLMG